jgi:Flp pilus assembly protein TadD
MVFMVVAAAQDSQTEKWDRQYQTAVAQYEAGKYKESAAQLEDLLPHAPNSYEIHELLGVVYASLSEDAKAIPHLELAVRLKPDSAEARSSLAATLNHAGKNTQAGEQFRKAQALAPEDFDTNHNLGEFYVQSGKLGDARPFLERAQRINPSSYDNSYDLAMADYLSGQLAEARQAVQSLLEKKNTGELHNLLGQIEEKDGKFLVAVNEFEMAAHMDPSDDNLEFSPADDWPGDGVGLAGQI